MSLKTEIKVQEEEEEKNSNKLELHLARKKQKYFQKEFDEWNNCTCCLRVLKQKNLKL